MPISFRLRTSTLCVAGALLVPYAALAQSTTPSIIPVDGSVAPVPQPVTSVPTQPTSTQPYIESMELKDTDVTEALSMISSQFKVPVAIFGVTGKINYLNLTGQTPQQAIETIVRTVGLSLQKSPEGTYIISNAPVAPAVTQPLGAPSIIPNFTQNNSTSGFGNGLGTFASPTAGIVSSGGEREPELIKTGQGGDTKKRTFKFALKNVKPSLMAYWLDPAGHEMPPEIRKQNQLNDRYTAPPIQILGGNMGASSMQVAGGSPSPYDTKGVVPSSSAGTIGGMDSSQNPYIQSNSESVRTLADAQFGGNNNGGGGGRGGNNGGGVGGRGGNQGVFQLPPNVDRIVAVDPQNALLVFGTPQGANELAQTINFLDRPLRQVEIEAQFVSVNVTDARGYGLDFTTARGNFNSSSAGNVPGDDNGALQFGFIRGNFQAALSAFRTDGRNKVINAPRVLAINNLTASLQQSIYNPIVLNTTTTAVGNAAVTNNAQNFAFIQTSIGLDVTPTINNDDTITVLMQPFVSDVGPANSDAATAAGFQTVTQQTLSTIANVRDGETIALGGLRRKEVRFSRNKIPLLSDIPFIGDIFGRRTSSESDTELIIFLKATIVRRAGDDDTGIPGTNIAIGG